MATQKSIPDAQELIWLGGGGHSMPPPPSDKGLKSDKVMINVKQESVVENYEALKEENNDPLSAIVDRIDNNEDITIDEMLIAIEKICAS